MSELKAWTKEGKQIRKTYTFQNYYETMAFVNASAWISHQEDHHPQLIVDYKTVEVIYTTHSAGGLTDKDFRCAELLDQL